MSRVCNLHNLLANEKKNVLRKKPHELKAFSAVLRLKDQENGGTTCVEGHTQTLVEIELGNNDNAKDEVLQTQVSCETASEALDMLYNTRAQIACILRNHSWLSNTNSYQQFKIKIRSMSCSNFHARSAPMYVLQDQDLPAQVITDISSRLGDMASKLFTLLRQASGNASQIASDYRIPGSAYQQGIIEINELEELIFPKLVETTTREATLKNGVHITVESMAGELCDTEQPNLVSLLVAHSLVEQTLTQVFDLPFVRKTLHSALQRKSADSRELKRAGRARALDADDGANLIALLIVGAILYWLYQKSQRRT